MTSSGIEKDLGGLSLRYSGLANSAVGNSLIATPATKVDMSVNKCYIAWFILVLNTS